MWIISLPYAVANENLLKCLFKHTSPHRKIKILLHAISGKQQAVTCFSFKSSTFVSPCVRKSYSATHLYCHKLMISPSKFPSSSACTGHDMCSCEVTKQHNIFFLVPSILLC